MYIQQFTLERLALLKGRMLASRQVISIPGQPARRSKPHLSGQLVEFLHHVRFQGEGVVCSINNDHSPALAYGPNCRDRSLYLPHMSSQHPRTCPPIGPRLAQLDERFCVWHNTSGHEADWSL